MKLCVVLFVVSVCSLTFGASISDSTLSGQPEEIRTKRTAYDGTSGCHKGYCWASCNGAFIVNILESPEWCYTSKDSYTQSYNYVTCTTHHECSDDWKCAGPCSV